MPRGVSSASTSLSPSIDFTGKRHSASTLPTVPVMFILGPPRRRDEDIALPVLPSDRVGELLQPRAGQQVAGGDRGGICPYQLDQSGAGDLRGQRLAELPEVLLLGLAAASRVRPDRR